MKRPSVEQFARTVSPETVASVRATSTRMSSARKSALFEAFDDLDATRTQAAQIKDYVLDNLKTLLTQFELKCRLNGVRVLWASDAASANRRILEICHKAAPDGGIIVKAKSMATEEIHLNKHLAKAGFEVVETDLGEYVVQIDDDMPSHIVAPIIHKSRSEVGKSFEREGLGPYTDDPSELAMRARAHLRDKFRAAKIGISGVNFGIAESGRIVLVENEGNSRLSTTAPDVHIAVMGIEKLLPGESDLALFLRLLAGSATGQRITTYTHLISGPRRKDEGDGPKEVHLILLDNGRSKILNGPYREILRCIRCGACLNICPVYRQASGHAYKSPYSGPVGAVLGPALGGVEKRPDLAKASTLCGECEEVCPVKIPIPKLLLNLRDEAVRKGVVKDAIPWGTFSVGTTSGFRWRMGLKLLPMAGLVKHPMKAAWEEFKELPTKEGRDFRGWWRGRS
ncbi:MAG: LutB/LldF family L-lactate oxidation iron-sulfur protein [Fimbriimonas sp.]|nr:LutB/LldF family L-lactate oxidation iron-sulfur protein [Fimbriimonas sp.]